MATPSSTARVSCARLVVRLRLTNPPRTFPSRPGAIEPTSQGRNSTRPLPGRTEAAASAALSKASAGITPVANASSAYTTLRNKNSRALPPTPFSAMTKYFPGKGLGTLITPCSMSPALKSTCVTITDVVPTMIEQAVASSAPVPTADVIESIVPVTTTADEVMPRCSAASAVTGPRISS